MCIITGFWNFTKSDSHDELISVVLEMRDIMCHRRPDDRGAWVNQESGVALGFRRLAILDLFATGHQPMLSTDEGYVMIFKRKFTHWYWEKKCLD